MIPLAALITIFPNFRFDEFSTADGVESRGFVVKAPAVRFRRIPCVGGFGSSGAKAGLSPKIPLPGRHSEPELVRDAAKERREIQRPYEQTARG